MSTTDAVSLKNAQELLLSGKYKEITLAFDINADDFFSFAAEWCDKGAKIKKGDKFFTISMKKPRIPPND
ncbi:hypothetical protein [Serratia sp. MF2]|uniref:hypothetical protein n=1 Tax=Serratia sp. MF2 TaxID=3059173 RepID=UPI0027FB492C|nr:hypothetical protein [Serratia sp. MF2]MDQ7100905.1 hypothetical protein [Serratia sp. MF2]